MLKNLRNVLPLPRSWKDEEHHFGMRVNDAITELLARRVAKIRMNGEELKTDKNDVADLGNVAKTIYLTSADSTWAKVWEKISILAVGETACFAANNNAIKTISDNVRNNTVYGTITRSASAVFQISASNSNLNWITMRLTNASASGCTYTESAVPMMIQLSASEGANSYTIGNSSRIRIDMITSANTRMGYVEVYSSSGGSMSYKGDVGSKIALSSGSGTLTVTCTDGGTVLYCTVYAGSIAPAT